MAEKKERDYVNPKRLLRDIMKSLPAEDYVRATVVALWMFCNDYIEKDDVANGTVTFSGSVSYSQLAALLAIGESTAKWRMNQLRDKYELVEWERTNYGIEFTFGVHLSPDGTPPSAKRTGASRPATHFTDVWRESESRDAHVWVDLLHTTQRCSACGKIRANLPKWTAVDDLEAEYMAWLEEDAPDNWNPFDSLWAYPRPAHSAHFLEQPYGDSRQKSDSANGVFSVS
jgi:hypothetical protein